MQYITLLRLFLCLGVLETSGQPFIFRPYLVYYSLVVIHFTYWRPCDIQYVTSRNLHFYVLQYLPQDSSEDYDLKQTSSSLYPLLTFTPSHLLSFLYTYWETINRNSSSINLHPPFLLFVHHRDDYYDHFPVPCPCH